MSDILTAFELHSPGQMFAALDGGVDPLALIRGKSPMTWLTEMYSRSANFPRCVRILLDRGAVLDDPAIAPVLLNDVAALKAALRDIPSTSRRTRGNPVRHSVSPDDRRFLEDFEACRVQPAAFDHHSHIRLAYIYLAEHDTETALAKMRTALQTFIAHHGIPAAKYHETLTRAWILAVHHFMATSPGTASAADFINANPAMLDTKIMLTHYSAAVLFSPEARARFVEPDLDGIPRHDKEPSC